MSLEETSGTPELMFSLIRGIKLRSSKPPEFTGNVWLIFWTCEKGVG